MLESASVACSHSTPVLLVAYDMATEAPFDAVHGIAEHLGVALVLAPAGSESVGDLGQATNTRQAALAAYDLRFVPLAAGVASSSMPAEAQLRALAESNPMGCALSLLEQLVGACPTRPLHFAAAPAALVELRPRAENRK